MEDFSEDIKADYTLMALEINYGIRDISKRLSSQSFAFDEFISTFGNSHKAEVARLERLKKRFNNLIDDIEDLVL